MEVTENNTSLLSEVCRLCSSTEGQKLPIFADEEELSFKILVCVSVQVLSDDVLSTLICQKCLNHVNEWYQFKQLCESAQEKQNEWLSKLLRSNSDSSEVEVKIEPTDDISEADDILEEEIIEDEIPNVIPSEQEIKQEELDDYCDEELPELSAISVSTSEPLGYSLQQTERQQNELKRERHHIAASLGLHIEEEETDVVGPATIYPQAAAQDDTFARSPVENVVVARRPEPLVRSKGKVTRRFVRGKWRENHYTCTVCSKGFSTSTCLRRHMMIHKGMRYACSICRVPLSSTSSLARHMRIHTGLKPYSCLQCRVTFTGRAELSVHRRKCGHQAAVPVYMEETQVPMSNRRKGVSCRCTVCHMQFVRKADLRRHMRFKHSLSCRWCKMSFDNKDNLKVHLKSHQVVPKRVKRYLCKFCPEVMTQWHQSIKHRQLHLDNQIPSSASTSAAAPPPSPPRKKTMKPYECHVCNLTFTYWKDYIKHRATHDGAGPSGRGVGALSMQVRKPRRYECDTCEESFTQWYAFVRHKQQHSNNDVASTSDSKAGVQRQFVSKTKPPTLLVKKTLNASDRNPRCPICHKHFRSGAMERHMTSHTNSKAYSCPLCQRKMKYATSVQHHLKMMHQVEHHAYDIKPDPNPAVNLPPAAPTLVAPSVKREGHATTQTATPGAPGHRFTCHVCDKSFTSKEFLLTHHQIIHKGAKGYKCKMCPQIFLQQSLLDVHEATHVKREVNRPAPSTSSASKNQSQFFKCPVCPKVFNSKLSLDGHQTRVGHLNNHMEIKIKIYSCSMCQNSYNNEAALHTHRFESHGVGVSPEAVGEYDCHVCRRSFNNNGSLKRHLQNVHIKSIDSTTSPEPQEPNRSTTVTGGELDCQLCGKHFADAGGLRAHKGWHFRVTHTSPKLENLLAEEPISSEVGEVAVPNHTCSLCKKSFLTSKSLKIHVTKAHTAVKTERLSHANNHGLVNEVATPKPAPIDGIPLGDNQGFSCSVCQKTFQNQVSCRMHLIKAHSTLKKELVSNEAPGVSATTSADTSLPINIDQSCSVCNKSFNTPKGCKIHLALVHGVTSTNTPLKVERSAAINEPSDTTVGVDTPILSTIKKLSAQRNAEDSTCSLCQKTFVTPKGCKLHMWNVHTKHVKNEAVDDNRKNSVRMAPSSSKTTPLNRRALTCDLCVKTFRTTKAFKIHYAWHMRNPNSIASVSDAVRKQLIENYAKEKLADTPPTLTKNDPLSTSPTLAQMQRSVKRPIPVLTPMKLSQASTSKSAGSETHVCNICNLSFPSDTLLNAHIFTHSPMKVDEIRDCKFCLKRFSNKGNLGCHLKICKLNINKETLLSPTFEADCHFCRKTFRRKNNLLLHMTECLKRPIAPVEPAPPKPENLSSVDKNRECKSCFRVFSSRGNLWKHVKICKDIKRVRPTKHGKLKSTMPESANSATISSTVSSSSLPNPMYDETLSLKKSGLHTRYQCSLCPNHYATSRSLLSHKMWHSRKPQVKLEPAVTPIVEASTAAKDSSNAVVPFRRNSHLLKDWICNICSQSFLGKKALAIHRNTHNVKKMGLPAVTVPAPAALPKISKGHPCKTCNKVFSDAGYLRGHINRVHVKQIFSPKVNGKAKNAVRKRKKYTKSQSADTVAPDTETSTVIEGTATLPSSGLNVPLVTVPQTEVSL